VEVQGAQSLKLLATRAGWNLIDQVISSASNVALSILIARTVSRQAFGAFAVSFTVFSFLVGIERSIGRYPLVIKFGSAAPSAYRRAAGDATGSVCVLGLLSGLLTVVVGVALGGQVGTAFVAMGVVLPAVLLQDAWRGVLIGAGRPAAAALNDAVWTVSQFLAIACLIAAGVPSASVLVLTWGATGGLAAAFGVVQTGTLPRPRATRRWVIDHWDQAGFYMAEWVLVLGAIQTSLLLIAASGSVQDVGALRGAQVLLGPLTLVAAGAFEFAIPELVRRPHLTSRDQVRAAWLLSGGLALLTLAWGGIALALPTRIGHSLLGETWPSVRVVLPASILWSCAILFSTGPAVVLRLLGRARVAFEISALTPPMLLIFSLVGLHYYGAAGAAAGFALSQWIVAPVWWIRLRSAVYRVQPVSSPGKSTHVE
jgi:O-antigen/teichoic acid export membrane protein